MQKHIIHDWSCENKKWALFRGPTGVVRCAQTAANMGRICPEQDVNPFEIIHSLKAQNRYLRQHNSLHGLRNRLHMFPNAIALIRRTLKSLLCEHVWTNPPCQGFLFQQCIVILCHSFDLLDVLRSDPRSFAFLARGFLATFSADHRVDTQHCSINLVFTWKHFLPVNVLSKKKEDWWRTWYVTNCHYTP